MIKEKYTYEVEEYAINLVNTNIDSIRSKKIKKTGIRIYKDNLIGVAGAIGEYNEQELEKKALDNLSLNIPYPYKPEENREEKLEVKNKAGSPEKFINDIEHLVKDLKLNFKDFFFSNKFYYSSSSISLENSANLNLKYSSTGVGAGILIKHKESSNLIDAIIGFEGWKFDSEEFLRLTEKILKNFNKVEDIENGKYLVVFVTFESYTILGKMIESLHGLIYGTGSSLLSNKMGQKIFSDKLTLFQTRNPEDNYMGPFFDFEGVVNKNYRYNFIKEGVLISPFTDKKTAAMFNLPLTGSAAGEYDSVPNLGIPHLSFKTSDKTIKELLEGKKAIFILMSAGGDFTPDGNFAAPVQLSFLYDGENFIARLPQLSISSNFFDMFGKDFVGVSKDNLTNLQKSNIIVMNMNVTKI